MKYIGKRWHLEDGLIITSHNNAISSAAFVCHRVRWKEEEEGHLSEGTITTLLSTDQNKHRKT
jgi:hypothetical protein